MKKIVALVLLVAFLAGCSQYTCPTYSKGEQKNAAKERKI
jgi:PBP1b-binding outer membrane lipoprotein LpoB